MAAAFAASGCGEAKSGLGDEAVTLDSLLTVAEAYVGDTMTLRGIAATDCCDGALYVTDSACTNKIRIASTAPDFCSVAENGQAVCVRGVIREDRVTRDELASKAAEADSLRRSGAISEEMCERVQNAIAAKKAYMDFTRRDYYSEFYIQGTSIEAE